MPRVAIKTGMTGADGKEVVLQEYLCDYPKCPNIAEVFIGGIAEIRATVVLCAEHAVMIRDRRRTAD
jgi:hypothetical protein